MATTSGDALEDLGGDTNLSDQHDSGARLAAFHHREVRTPDTIRTLSTWTILTTSLLGAGWILGALWSVAVASSALPVLPDARHRRDLVSRRHTVAAIAGDLGRGPLLLSQLDPQRPRRRYRMGLDSETSSPGGNRRIGGQYGR